VKLAEHTLTTSVIEIAGDRKTAKGVWNSPGHETMPIGERPIAHWCWNRYGVDFILENSEWKLPLGERMPGMHPPDLPVTFNQPYTGQAWNGRTGGSPCGRFLCRFRGLVVG
jgi:hypothetical protein